MKLATFNYKNSDNNRVGVVVDDGIVDLTAFNSQVAADMRTLLRHGKEGIFIARKSVGKATPIPLKEVSLQAPVPDPKICLALGGNYPSHIEEVAPIFGELSEKIYWSGKFVNDSNGELNLKVGKTAIQVK